MVNEMNIGQNTAKFQFTGDFPSALALARGGNSS